MVSLILILLVGVGILFKDNITMSSLYVSLKKHHQDFVDEVKNLALKEIAHKKLYGFYGIATKMKAFIASGNPSFNPFDDKYSEGEDYDE